MDILKTLQSLSDESYRDFHAKLIPNVNKELIIGVRTPQLKSFAKSIVSTKLAENFINQLPHKYYEENNLHAFLLNEEKDFEKCVILIEKFLPYVDNWATCDGLRPKSFNKNKEKLLPYIYRWLSSKHAFTIRFAIEMLMVHFLDDDFSPKYLEIVSKIVSNEYYVNMMIAWYFATALAKKYDFAIKYLEERMLSEFVHNKTIQKAIESFRITKEHKGYLRSLKI